MENQNQHLHVAIIGGSGAIGMALVDVLTRDKLCHITSYSRTLPQGTSSSVQHQKIDYQDEQSIELAAESVADNSLDLVIVATGLLHSSELTPEKSLKQLKKTSFEKIFLVNTIGPALVAKHFIPKLKLEQRSVFAILSARVGSISDNRLGGWYAYRASKAALNMIIKTTSIEVALRRKHAVIVGLHPGTVDSKLSSPFQSRVPKRKLFTPEYSAEKLLSVIANLTSSDSGKTFAWDGQIIEP
jgi:NAD(P)-dependent dehydrogenase (short-subunit alcohol dehydrogenase family)